MEQFAQADSWVFDAHSDIPSALHLAPVGAQRLRHHVAILHRSRVGAVIACLWGYARPQEQAQKQQLRQLDLLEEGLALLPGANLCRTPGELLAARADGRTAIVLGIEGMAGDITHDYIHHLHQRGVRHAMLRWNHDNALVEGGHLTNLGKEVVREIRRRRWIVDVSHLPEAAFWEVLAEVNGPVLASHSNAAALTPHPRNLTDSQMLAVARGGGVIGLNAWPEFLSEGRAVRSDFIRHLCHTARLVGWDHVAFGFDFCDYLVDVVDLGQRTLTSGLEGSADVPALLSDLMDHGLASAELRSVAHGNLLDLWLRTSAD